MPSAARVGDPTGHPGVVTGPGVATVMIGGMSAAVAGDLHTCSFPGTPPHPPTPFPMGSTSVMEAGASGARAWATCPGAAPRSSWAPRPS